MDIYALLIYDKENSGLRLSEKCFREYSFAVKFLEENKFYKTTSEHVFASSKYFCRIKKITIMDSVEPKQLNF